jgi:hypothetical protein
MRLNYLKFLVLAIRSIKCEVEFDVYCSITWQVQSLLQLIISCSLCTCQVIPGLPTNIRQGWKEMEVANPLAYYDMATIIAVKVL